MKKISNNEFYEKAIKEYGVTAQGVHWNSKFTQYKRFEVITSNIKKIKNCSLVDVGCGFGEYYNYLEINNLAPKGYIGIDSVGKMVDISKKRFSDKIFLKKDVLKDDLITADYYVCSGAMNTMNYSQCEAFIEKCFNYSKKGFIFNFLKGLTFNNITKGDILTLCKKLCRNIQIKEGYLDNDFTIIMIK